MRHLAAKIYSFKRNRKRMSQLPMLLLSLCTRLYFLIQYIMTVLFQIMLFIMLNLEDREKRNEKCVGFLAPLKKKNVASIVYIPVNNIEKSF